MKNPFVDWDIYRQVFPTYITQGLANTILLSLLAALIGTVFGILLGALAGSRHIVVRAISAVYTNIMRALPAMLTIYMIGQGLPLAGIKLFGDSTYGYAAFAIGLMEAAYLGEIFRSGMQSVDRTYVESGISFGLPQWKILATIILPIGIRRIIPALANQYILIIKSTSLVYLLGLSIEQRDLFSMAKDDVGLTGSLAPLVVAGVAYMILILPLTWLVEWLNTRLNRRYGTAGGAIEANTEA